MTSNPTTATTAIFGEIAEIGVNLLNNLTTSNMTTKKDNDNNKNIIPSALSALMAATRSPQFVSSSLTSMLSISITNDNLYTGSPSSISTITSTAITPGSIGSSSGSSGSTPSDSSGGDNTAATEATSDDLIHNEFVQIFFCILYTTVFILGVFGNVLVCYVVLRNRAMQTVTNIFITNLALSDILLCVLAVPFTPLYTFMKRWAFGRTLCHLVSFAQGCSIYISTLTLTSIAIDRYFVIIYPFHQRMKLSTCIAIIIIIWVISLLATLPYGMYMKVTAETVYANNNTAVNETTTSGGAAAALGINGTGSINGINGINNDNTIHYDALHWNHDAMEYMDSIDAAALLTGETLSSSSASAATASATEAYMQLLTPTTITTAAANAYYAGSGSGPLNSISGVDIGSGIVIKTYCEENWPSEQYRKVFGSVTTILQFVLPFIIISICYTWVSIKLNQRARAKPGSKSSRREEADRDRKKRTNRMLISMVAVFGLSWLPINVVNIFDDFYEKSNEWRFYTLFFFVAHSIAMSSTCYNPFLYAWLNENFRKEFKHVLPCFNPSNNNNIINIARGYNRSERNTCGPRLRHGSDFGGGGGMGGGMGDGIGDGLDDDHDDNGITQETTCLPKDKLLIIPREPTYGNGKNIGPLSPQRFGFGGSGGVGGGGGVNNSNARHVEILLNESGCDSMRRSRTRRMNTHRNDTDEIDSGDEQTVEMRFCETPFVSSDNTTAISMLETSTSNDIERSGATTSSSNNDGYRNNRCN